MRTITIELNRDDVYDLLLALTIASTEHEHNRRSEPGIAAAIHADRLRATNGLTERIINACDSVKLKISGTDFLWNMAFPTGAPSSTTEPANDSGNADTTARKSG